MKNVSLLLVVFLLLTVSVKAENSTPVPAKTTAALRLEIVDLIGENCPYDYNKDECTARVLFTVNLKGEIIVISVDSPNKLAESFIKQKLNYQKVNFKPTKEGSIYLLPLRMKKTY